MTGVVLSPGTLDVSDGAVSGRLLVSFADAVSGISGQPLVIVSAAGLSGGTATGSCPGTVGGTCLIFQNGALQPGATFNAQGNVTSGTWAYTITAAQWQPSASSPIFRIDVSDAAGNAFSADNAALVAAGVTSTIPVIDSATKFDSMGFSSGLVVMRSPVSTSIEADATLAPSGMPSGELALVGSVAYTVTNVPVGGSIDVKITLPPGSAPTKIYKVVSGAYVDVTSLATIVGDVITMHLTDGSVGDDDGVANGVVVDPVVPARPSTPPSISSFGPSSGPVGTVVTITGTHFTGASAVKFNGVDAATYSVVADTKIKATVAAGTTKGKITVTTADGTATSAGVFTVAVPKITGFTPSGGPVGVVVTITGTHFAGASAVRFNGTDAAMYTVVSDTKIRATVATGTTKGKISVITPSGTATSATVFTIAVPKITAFTPSSGPVRKVVTITGSGFKGASAVAFNGKSALTFVVISNTKIKATVPVGATSGKITVTTPSGTARSAGKFTVTKT